MENLWISVMAFEPPGCWNTICAEGGRLHPRGRVGSLKRQAEPCASKLMGSQSRSKRGVCSLSGADAIIGTRLADEILLARSSPICWSWVKVA